MSQFRPNQQQQQDPLAAAWNLHKAGRFAQAEQIYHKILKQHPNHPATLRVMGMLMRQTGRLRDAVKYLQKAVRANPGLAASHGELGLALILSNRIDDGISSLEQAIKIDPQCADAYFHMGKVFAAQYDFDKCVEMTRKALTINPGHPEYHATLGYAYLRQGLLEESIKHTQAVLDVQKDSPMLYCQLATALRHQGNFDEAMVNFEKALALDKDNAEAIAGQAQILESQGESEKALALIEQAIARGAEVVPLAVAYDRSARRLGKIDGLQSVMSYIEKLLKNEHISPIERITLLFRQGGLYELQENYDAAFQCFKEANEQHPQIYDVGTGKDLLEQTKTVFTHDRLRQDSNKADNSSELPVFIVGMPRSGTSLVEQILASHPQVYGAGELFDIERIANTLHKTTTGTEETYPLCINDIIVEQLNNLANAHLKQLQKIANDDTITRVTDKLPGNYMRLGLISLLFPKARIIHCIRHPLDTCLSCFVSQLPTAHVYSNSLSGLADHYIQYQQYMDYWRTVLDLPLYEVVYEELIENQETISRKLIEFMGLEWDDTCLRFHESKRVVHTLSTDQVRKPIYRSAIHRYKNYESHLQPLIEALSDYVP